MRHRATGVSQKNKKNCFDSHRQYGDMMED